MAEFEKTPEENRKVYSGFLGYTKWMIVAVFILLIALLFFTYSPPAPPPAG